MSKSGLDYVVLQNLAPMPMRQAGLRGALTPLDIVLTILVDNFNMLRIPKALFRQLTYMP